MSFNLCPFMNRPRFAPQISNIGSRDHGPGLAGVVFPAHEPMDYCGMSREYGEICLRAAMLRRFEAIERCKCDPAPDLAGAVFHHKQYVRRPRDRRFVAGNQRHVGTLFVVTQSEWIVPPSLAG